MLIELITMLSVGLISSCIGILIWKQGKISLIHSYHYTKVKEKDKKDYTTIVGKGTTIIGVGCISTGVFNYIAKTSGGWILFCIAFFYGFVLIAKAQKKYNGGFF